MTDDEFDKLMTKIAKELPDQANSEMLALIIINIILFVCILYATHSMERRHYFLVHQDMP